MLALILVIFLALKYMEVCLFLFFFGSIDVLREVSDQILIQDFSDSSNFELFISVSNLND